MTVPAVCPACWCVRRCKKKKKKHYTIRRGLRNAIFRPLNSPNGEQRSVDDLGTPSYD